MLEFVMKYRNFFLLGLLVVMLTVSTRMNQDRLNQEADTVSLPLTYASTEPISEMERYRQDRDDTALQDMAALQALVDDTTLDKQTREDAAARLQLLVDSREKQAALEGALLESTLWPCVAVVTQGSVSIVTEKQALTDKENAMLLELVQAHTGIDPSGVRVVTGKKK